MATPLLRTKLAIPPLRAGLVPRTRLIEQLDAGLQQGHKLTLVSAPAGYGKTTLVAAWIHGRSGAIPPPAVTVGRAKAAPPRAAWLSLDEHDDDLGQFLAYLVAALQTVEPSVGQSLQNLLNVPNLPSIEVLLTPLINDLAATTSPLVLVLDDLHTSTFPTLYPALEFWVEQAPPHVHTVLITRQDPPLPLARWRVRGQATEVRQRDLCFSPQEAAAFLERATGHPLSRSDLSTIEKRTEGWVAGLQMAALALQGAESGDVSRLVTGFSGRHHFVLDYLTDEVLGRQPARMRAFLLNTCVLEQMSGSLCDWLVAETDGERAVRATWRTGDAQEMLESLEHANLFIVPLDHERTWYRYHRLFAELLRSRLRAEQPGEIPVLHRRAAAWYEREGWGAQAVHHALQAGDAAWAADVIERVLQQRGTVSRLDGATLLDWLAALPPAEVRARPRLQLLAARACYVTGQSDRAEGILKELEQDLTQNAGRSDQPPDPDTEAILAGIAADRASYAALCGEVRHALQWARPALEASQAPESPALAKLRPASVLGLASLRAGEVQEAGAAFQLAADAAQEAGIPFAAVPLLCNLAEVHFVQGRLRQALACCDQADALSPGASSADAPSGVDREPASGAGFVHSMRAKVAYERGELDAAAAHARQATTLLRQVHVTLGQETVLGLLACIEQTRGDEQAANTALEQTLEMAHGNDVPRLISLALANQARVRLAQGAIKTATRWADEYSQSQETEYLREYEDLTLARIELARDRPRTALAILDRLLAPAQAAGRWGTAIEALVLRARALHDDGQDEQALSALSQALEHASPEGYVRLFSEGGEQMRALLAQVAHLPGAERAALYADRLLGAFEPQQPGRKARQSAAPPSQALTEPLTARELDVLDLLAQGLTNAEIGQRLVISLPTVKSHTRNLYGKLGVHSRRAAVVRARELGLLNDSATEQSSRTPVG